MKSYRIASIPGDGIGNEVIPAGMDVLAALASKEGFDLKFEYFDWSSARYQSTRAALPDGARQRQACLGLDIAPLAGKLQTRPQATADPLEDLHVPGPVRAWYFKPTLADQNH